MPKRIPGLNRIVILLYDLIFLILFLFCLPYLIFRRKTHRGFLMRFGIFPQPVQTALQQGKNIWVHAVSVGEVLAIRGLVRGLKERFPGYQVVLSTVTKAGYTVASSQLKEADTVIYGPVDLSGVVGRYLDIIRPQIYVVAETEIWPNLFRALEEKEIPIVLVNGRISDKAFRGYFPWRYFFKRILKGVGCFCMQSQRDAVRLIHFGASPDKVQVVGNIKFDDLPLKAEFGLRDFGFNGHESLWIAGSTHPGEEEVVLKFFRSLLGEFPDLRLVIAPRHVERTGEVAQLIRGLDLKPVRLSELHAAKPDHRSVVIVDTLGHLRSLYSLSKIVFVGKSLTAVGGHNIIEPAFFANAIFVGPHMQNFRDIIEIFLQQHAVIQVQNSEELSAQIRQLLKNPDEIKRIGHLAREVIQQYRGATPKTLAVISELLTGAA